MKSMWIFLSAIFLLSCRGPTVVYEPQTVGEISADLNRRAFDAAFESADDPVSMRFVAGEIDSMLMRSGEPATARQVLRLITREFSGEPFDQVVMSLKGRIRIEEDLPTPEEILEIRGFLQGIRDGARAREAEED